MCVNITLRKDLYKNIEWEVEGGGEVIDEMRQDVVKLDDV